MTTPNPTLKKLGLSNSDRAVILHADDVGNLHLTKDTPQLREAVSEKDWPCRVGDYETFLDTAVGDAVQASGIHLLGYRALRDLMPGRGGAG